MFSQNLNLGFICWLESACTVLRYSILNWGWNFFASTCKKIIHICAFSVFRPGGPSNKWELCVPVYFTQLTMNEGRLSLASRDRQWMCRAPSPPSWALSTASLIAMETYAKYSQLTLKILCLRSNKPLSRFSGFVSFLHVTVYWAEPRAYPDTSKNNETDWAVWKLNQLCNIKTTYFNKLSIEQSIKSNLITIKPDVSCSGLFLFKEKCLAKCTFTHKWTILYKLLPWPKWEMVL